jgi:hypothetical protein
LAQESLKIELQLKRYEDLKLLGLDCKYTGARSGFVEKPRASVQGYRIKQNSGLFWIGKWEWTRSIFCGPKGPSVHDEPRTGAAGSSSERGLTAAPGHCSLPQQRGNGEGDVLVLTLGQWKRWSG